jgi:phosphatidylglycerol:prolipoprotein diacylglycerol transferase
MEIDGSWYLPVFFFEQIGNIVGLLLIYFACEFITSKKIRKVGSLGILYFLWYGIVRLIMTPLRMAGGRSDGEFINLVTTIVWIVAGLSALIINTLLIPKYCRKYRILFVSWCSIAYFFKRIFKGWDNRVLEQQYHYEKSKFVRRNEDMFWYNGY